MATSSSRNVKSFATLTAKSVTTIGIADFLRQDATLIALLPTIERLRALKKDCQALLPAIYQDAAKFDMSEIFDITTYEEGHLTLTALNAAQAAKLRQIVPTLQEALQKRGWQVNVVRVRVQVKNIPAIFTFKKQAKLSTSALAALTQLEEALPDSALKHQIAKLLGRY